MNILLIMRYRMRSFREHIDALRRLGVSVHLLTETEALREDGRFASVTVVPDALPEAEVVEIGAALAKRTGSTSAITFLEEDIVVAADISEAIGAVASPEAARISRDKSRQRALLARHGIPSVRFAPL